MFDTLQKIGHLLGRENWRRWSLLILSAVFASVVEMVGAVLIYVLLAFISDTGGVVVLPLIGEVGRADGAATVDSSTLAWAAAGIGGFFVFRAGLQMFLAYAKQRMAQNAGARLSVRLMRGYLDLPYTFHITRNSSELVRNAHTTIREVASKGMLQATYVITESVMIGGLVLVMIVIAPVASVLVVAVLGSAALILLRIVQPRMKYQGEVAQDTEKRLLGAMQQSLYGIRDIKVLHAQEYFSEHYRRSRLCQARSLYLHGSLSEFPRHIIETALLGFILSFATFSILTDVRTEELMATLGLFAYAGIRLLPSIQRLVSGLNGIKFIGPAIDNVSADLRLVEALDGGSSRAHVEVSFSSSIAVDGATYSYPETDVPALVDISLVIERGELVGICGPTGSGKTTLTDLLTGLLVPTSGRILVDDTDLEICSDGWTQRLGIVPQMVFLTDDSLRRNIALGVADDDIDVEALWEAVDLAQLRSFVEGLARGIDTMVGERGVRVSGGQRQRIAIARALYRRPDVLIFDEGTSALDNATEALLMGSLERLRGDHTIILVAHRLSTVRNADKIVFLQQGRVSGVGSFDELRRGNQAFAEMAQRL